MKKILMLFGFLAMFAVVSPVNAASRQGEFQLGAGAGFSASPLVFDFNVNGEYFAWEHISLGLNLDALLRGDAAFAAVPFVRYHFDIDRAPEWVPYVGVGVGGIFGQDGGSALDIMLPNVGVRYEAISDRLFVGTDLSGHILTDFDNSNFDFRWLIATVSYRF